MPQRTLPLCLACEIPRATWLVAAGNRTLDKQHGSFYVPPFQAAIGSMLSILPSLHTPSL